MSGILSRISTCQALHKIPISFGVLDRLRLKGRVWTGLTTLCRDSAVTTVTQSLLYTGSESGKLLALRDLVSSGNLPYPSLVFVQSIVRADELYNTLVMDGLRVDVVHGDRGKGKRDEAVKAFRDGKVWMLVVTEVLARGMDFRGVKVVVNYGKP